MKVIWKQLSITLKIALLLGAVVVGVASLFWYLVAQTFGASPDKPRGIVDLGPYYTDRPNGAGLTWGFLSGPVELVAKLKGVRRFGGVSFSIKGIVQLRNKSTDDHPAAVKKIMLQKNARLIHILHGTCFWVSDGIPIAAIVLKYSDGETRTLFVCY